MKPQRPSDLTNPLVTAAGAPPNALGTGGGSSSAPVMPARARAISDARKYISRNELKQAGEALEPLIKARKPDAEALYLMGLVAERSKRLPDAERFARKSLGLVPHPEAQLLLARCLRVRGETDEVIRLCDEALARSPGNELALTIKGGALEEAGRYDDAEAVIEPLADGVTALENVRHLALADVRVKLHVQRKRYADAVALAERIVTHSEAPNDLKTGVYYTKAKAHDRAKQFGDAFTSATEANKFGAFDFSPDLYEEQVSVLIENWSRESMAAYPLSTCDSELPVFVAGMPRSGTSLIDQIIDAHPKAAGVGELATIEGFAYKLSAAYDPEKPPAKRFGSLDRFRWTRVAKDYVKHLEKTAPPGSERVVNKALGNNKLVGLIARLFPKTRIIHAVRDPRDVAISCFMGGFNNRLHPWTTRIDWAAKAWEQSRRMMDHWKATLDVPILEVNYERLVADPENEFPRLIDFLGLEWDDKCFEFHKSRRTVRTLSYDQVNRPLYTTSSGRHKNYEKQIEGIEFPEYDPWARED